METVIRQLCPPERYDIKCPLVRVPRFVVIHNTANDAPAENEIAYMLRREEEVSFHFAVDDREIIQGLPLDRNAWASGDGRGPGNLYGIHIEICYSRTGGPKFQAAEKNAARLTACLLQEYGWSLAQVKKHRDFDGKYCPHRTLDLGWQRFLDMVQQEMEEEPMTYEQWKEYRQRYEKEQAAKQVSPWAEPAVAYCKEHGIMNGDAGGNFRPRSYVTRQELAAALSQLVQAGETEA